MAESTKIIEKNGAGNPMESLIWFAGIVLFYFAMQLWILPKFGIST